MPRWPPASLPCAMITSAPLASSQRASCTVVADDSTMQPAAFTRCSSNKLRPDGARHRRLHDGELDFEEVEKATIRPHRVGSPLGFVALYLSSPSSQAMRRKAELRPPQSLCPTSAAMIGSTMPAP